MSNLPGQAETRKVATGYAVDRNMPLDNTEAPYRPIHPIKGQILVRQAEPKEQLASGLYIPTGHRDTYEDIAEILELGPGEIDATGERVPFSVAVGDRVVFARRAGTALFPDNREPDNDYRGLLMLREDDIVGIIEEDAP